MMSRITVDGKIAKRFTICDDILILARTNQQSTLERYHQHVHRKLKFLQTLIFPISTYRMELGQSNRTLTQNVVLQMNNSNSVDSPESALFEDEVVDCRQPMMSECRQQFRVADHRREKRVPTLYAKYTTMLFMLISPTLRLTVLHTEDILLLLCYTVI